MRYMQTGDVPDDSAAPGAAADGGEAGAGGATPTTPRCDSVEDRLDDVIRRQRELLREIERLRDEVRRGG